MFLCSNCLIGKTKKKQGKFADMYSYFCDMEGNKIYIRNIYWTAEFVQFYNELSDKVRIKFDYVLEIVKTERVISTKFVKRLENTDLYEMRTDLYEMRVSVGGNEYRTVMFQ